MLRSFWGLGSRNLCGIILHSSALIEGGLGVLVIVVLVRVCRGSLTGFSMEIVIMSQHIIRPLQLVFEVVGLQSELSRLIPIGPFLLGHF